MPEPFTLLAIDDDLSLLKSLGRIFRLEPVELLTTHEPKQALPLLKHNLVDLVLLDLRMPGQDGMTLLLEIKKAYPDLPVIMLTGHGSIHEAVKAAKLGAEDFLEKPCSPATLVQSVRGFYDNREQAKTLTEDHEVFDFPRLIGTSPVMQKLKAFITRIARSDANILIHGETGTGKELIAQSIHRHSSRRHKTFVPVDCATISENILESELFGHQQGAFTGAISHKKGLFMAADEGSLFLDEIGEFHLDLQAKLLRTLQERQVRPVGSNKALSVNIRLIAATNKDLEHEVQQGCFREDLFYRLATIIVEVPALRDRTGDIELLAKSLVQHLSPQLAIALDDDIITYLNRYSWPGNVRELENVMTRAVALCHGATIRVQDLPKKLQLGKSISTQEGESDLLAGHEKIIIEKVLNDTGGNRRNAAQILKISEATLYRKMKKFGLSKLRN
jgi:DNA-binding NtrC family response regulator